MSTSSNPDSGRSGSLKPKLDKAFEHILLILIIGAVVVVPVGLWIAKQFFGWQPPAWIDSVLKLISG